MLLGSIQAQGRLVAAALEPQLERASPGYLHRCRPRRCQPFLRRQCRPDPAALPAGQGRGCRRASISWWQRRPVPAGEPRRERRAADRPGRARRRAAILQRRRADAAALSRSLGHAEILTSVVPVLTPAGCWAIIFSYPVDDLPGKALGTPYWRRFEVQRACLIYLCLAILTLVVFLSSGAASVRFARLARVMRLGGTPTAGFAEQNEIAELDGVAAEFDRLVATLGPDRGEHPPARRGQRPCLQDAHRHHAPMPGAAAPGAARRQSPRAARRRR